MPVVVIREGDQSKPNDDPYTVAFIANPALEAPWQSGNFVADGMPANQAAFDAAVAYAVDCLFGLVPNQAEQFMSDPAIGPNVRVVALLEADLNFEDANALVGESAIGKLLAPRRAQIQAFAARFFDTVPDVIYAVSASQTYSRASAYGTTDDPTKAGTAFTHNGMNKMHWHFFQIPGTVAMHHSARSLTPLHEFGHAASSYSSGFLTDLYVNNVKAELNVGVGRPIPPGFGAYDGSAIASDATRDHLGYPSSWTSFHAALVAPAVPALMDNYHLAVGSSLHCRMDEISLRYMSDRIRAKVGR